MSDSSIDSRDKHLREEYEKFRKEVKKLYADGKDREARELDIRRERAYKEWARHREENDLPIHPDQEV